MIDFSRHQPLPQKSTFCVVEAQSCDDKEEEEASPLGTPVHMLLRSIFLRFDSPRIKVVGEIGSRRRRTKVISSSLGWGRWSRCR